MKLPSAETLREQIASDPDDEPTAGPVEAPEAALTSKKLTRYTPYLNGTAFMGMLKQNETHPEMFGPDHDWTHGPYVLAADADAEVDRLTRERDDAEQRVRDIDALWHGQRDVIAERDRLRGALTDAQKQLGTLSVLILQDDRDETLEWARGVKITFPNGEPTVAVESPSETTTEQAWPVPSGWRQQDPWFKVGDIVRPMIAGGCPFPHTVTEITALGFKYKHERWSLGPRYGWTEGGETYEPTHYELCPEKASGVHQNCQVCTKCGWNEDEQRFEIL